MNTLTIHKTTHASTSYGWLEYGLEYRIGNAEIHRIFSSSLIHCALDYYNDCDQSYMHEFLQEKIGITPFWATQNLNNVTKMRQILFTDKVDF